MKVLIVDDEKIVRKGIVSILQQAFPDMQTIAEASNGEEAMKTVKTLLPDIVITDVKMPVIDGMELTKMIHTFDAEIKVIVLSSYQEAAHGFPWHKTYLPARDFWIAGTELLLHDRFSGICSHRCIARLIKYRKPVWMSKWTFRTLWERRGQTSLLQSR